MRRKHGTHTVGPDPTAATPGPLNSNHLPGNTPDTGATYTGSAAALRNALGCTTPPDLVVHPAMAAAGEALVGVPALESRVRELRQPLLTATEYDHTHTRVPALICILLGLAGAATLLYYTSHPVFPVLALLAGVVGAWVCSGTNTERVALAAAARDHTRAVAAWDAHPAYSVTSDAAGTAAERCAAQVTDGYGLAAARRTPIYPLRHATWYAAHYAATGEVGRAEALAAACAAYTAAYRALPLGVRPPAASPTTSSIAHPLGADPVHVVQAAATALTALRAEAETR